MPKDDFSTKFSQEIAKLNPEQRQAVQVLEGPVLVFAGPGTGKTQVLTLRIANLIAQGVAEPTEILALTFTNVAVTNMRERLVKLIGPIAHQVSFHTFHSFCAQVLAENREYFPLHSQARPLDDLHRLLILEEIIKNAPLSVLRPAGKKYHYLSTLKKVLTKLKQEAITPEKLALLINQQEKDNQLAIEQELSKKRPSKNKIKSIEKNFAKQKELLLVYQQYQKKLMEKKYYDYDDMLILVADGFAKNPDLLAEYQERFQYFLVDEYQDTNNAQAKVISLLASYWQEPNYFVVGDPQQSIYRFQGANLENFLSFTKAYPKAYQITLSSGYRCSQLLYDLAAKLITEHTTSSSHSDFIPSAQLKAISHCQLPLLIQKYDRRDQEILAVFERIKTLQKEGVKLSQIAIIYRNNAELSRWRELAPLFELPFTTDAQDNVLEQPIIMALLNCWRLLVNLDDSYVAEEHLWFYLWQPLDLVSQLALLQLRAILRREQKLLITLILKDELASFISQLKTDRQLDCSAIDEKTINALQALGKTLLQYHALSLNTPLIHWFKQFLADFAFFPLPTSFEQLAAKLSLYTFERQLAAWQQEQTLFLSDALSMIDTLNEHQQDLPIQLGWQQTDAITFTTAHGAKGLEWDYVFITGLSKNNWDKLKERQLIPLPSGILSEQLDSCYSDDNTRLLYVALTRARKQAFISYHQFEKLGETERSPSLFFDFFTHSGNGVQNHQATSSSQEQLSQQLDKLLAPPISYSFKQEARDFFAQKVKTLIMSPTMLNDYLGNTEHFINRYLLEMPDFTPNVNREFGNSCHLVLEKMGQHYLRTGDLGSSEKWLALFSTDYQRKYLPEPEKSAYAKIGRDSLEAYYQQWSEQIKQAQPLACEKLLGSQGDLVVAGIPIRGKIDRIDLLSRQTGEVQAVDYKTGTVIKPAELKHGKLVELSEREKTLPIFLRSSVRRQLLFYKLLLDTDKRFPYQVNSGVLDFIKLTISSKPVKRQVPLLDEEVSALVELIQIVWREIMNLEFLADA